MPESLLAEFGLTDAPMWMRGVLARAVYLEVLESPRWRALRERLKAERSKQCQRCLKTWAPGSRTTLKLHHLTFERLGCERDSDVELLCGPCYERASLRDQARERFIEWHNELARRNGFRLVPEWWER